VREEAVTEIDPKRIMKQMGLLLDELKSGTSDKKNTIEKINQSISTAATVLNLENHYLAGAAVGESYRPFLIQFARDLVQEYECKTTSERATAQAIALSYTRILEFSERMNRAANTRDYSQERNGYYAVLSKDLDRAYRQFSSLLLLLKQLKSPPIELNIRTKNAFIAHNQQINSSPASINTEP
jgi:hypothetical protein